jgi:hypothetical protein
MRRPELEVASEMLAEAGDAVELLLTKGIDAAMTKYNRRGRPENGSET